VYLISSRGQPTGGGPPAFGLGRGLTTPHRKTLYLLRSSYVQGLRGKFDFPLILNTDVGHRCSGMV
jgi:hypothetical protein